MQLVQATAPLKQKSITKNYLIESYVMQKLSSAEISKLFGVCQNTVYNKLKLFDIPVRRKLKDITGMKFGRWKAIRRIENLKPSRAMWMCKCKCGTIKKVSAMSLLYGSSRSCGCLSIDKARLRKGKNHPSYKNGRSNKEGYVQLLDHDHPNSNKRGRVLEHVAVMSEHIGRSIRPGETIHHKNGIMVAYCIEYLNQYAPEKLKKEMRCKSNK